MNENLIVKKLKNDCDGAYTIIDRTEKKLEDSTNDKEKKNLNKLLNKSKNKLSSIMKSLEDEGVKDYEPKLIDVNHKPSEVQTELPKENDAVVPGGKTNKVIKEEVVVADVITKRFDELNKLFERKFGKKFEGPKTKSDYEMLVRILERRIKNG